MNARAIIVGGTLALMASTGIAATQATQTPPTVSMLRSSIQKSICGTPFSESAKGAATADPDS